MGALLAQIVRFCGRTPLLAQLLRRFAAQYVEGSDITIRCGYAHGLRWRRHHRYVNGYWLGQYELWLQERIWSGLREGGSFFDVGANAGFFTVLAAKRVGERGCCVAFDPDPANVESISEQLQLNGFSWCRVEAVAVSDSQGFATFAVPTPGSSTARLSADSNLGTSLTVPTATLDELATKWGIPDVVKIDIEGAEVLALRGAAELLKAGKTQWLIEVHGPEEEREVREIFETSGHRVVFVAGQAHNPDAWPHTIEAVLFRKPIAQP